MKEKRFLAMVLLGLLLFSSGCSLFKETPEKVVSETDHSVSANTEETPEIQKTEGYILGYDETTIYVDLENTGSRTYPGEGEDRKVAFDISDAEQIQTEVSEFNPARETLICSGIHVEIEYYVENGVNIATKISSNGDELEPIESFYQ